MTGFKTYFVFLCLFVFLFVFYILALREGNANESISCKPHTKQTLKASYDVAKFKKL